jgi:hypothetical protein
MKKKPLIWIGIILVIGFVSLFLSLLITQSKNTEIQSSQQTRLSIHQTNEGDFPSRPFPASDVSNLPPEKNVPEKDKPDNNKPVSSTSPPQIEIKNEAPPNPADKTQPKQSGTISSNSPVINNVNPVNSSPPLNAQPPLSENTNNKKTYPPLKPGKSTLPPSSINNSEEIACSELEKILANKNNDLELGWAKVGIEVLKLEQEGENLMKSLGKKMR